MKRVYTSTVLLDRYAGAVEDGEKSRAGESLRQWQAQFQLMLRSLAQVGQSFPREVQFPKPIIVSVGRHSSPHRHLSRELNRDSSP